MIQYVITKARRYRAIGPSKYRKGDYFQQPDSGLSEGELSLIATMMGQLADGLGFQPDEPLIGVGPDGIHLLLPVLHFQLDRIESNVTEQSILDACTATHVVCKKPVMMFVRCPIKVRPKRNRP